MSPKVPRNVSGRQLVKLFSKFGYEVTRQKGSHIRLSRISNGTDHHITVPNHNPLKLGTLSSILSDVAENLKISKDELLKEL